MQLKEMTKGVSKTVQEKQYEPIEMTCIVTGILEEGDDPDEAGNTLYALAKREVDKDLLKRAAELDCDSDLYERILGADYEVIDDE